MTKQIQSVYTQRPFMFLDQNNKEKKKKRKKKPFIFITNEFRVFILKIKFSTKIISKLCLVSVWIGLSYVHVLRLHFFFMRVQQFLVDNTLFMHCLYTIHHCLYTVHGTHNYFIQKKILKMGPTSLFTHLKFILLQCFQFSAK